MRIPTVDGARAAMLVVAMAAGLSACDLGSQGEGPKIAPIANQQTEFGVPIEVAVSLDVMDFEAPFVVLTATSIPGDMVPDSGLVFAGMGKDRTLTITPAPIGTGSVIITVKATDAGGRSNVQNFVLTVTGPFDEAYPKVPALVRSQDDYFGSRVAVQGEHALIGALRNSIQHDLAGAVFAHRLLDGGWLGFQMLTASDATAGSGFGSAIDISGAYAIVGAAYKAGQTGAAYIFHRSGNTWTEVDKLTASDGQAGDLFGSAVAIDGDTAIVGAPAPGSSGQGAGAAYLYTRTGATWTEVAKLEPPGGAEGDGFGAAVAISGTYVAVGAPNTTHAGSSGSGSAYLFRRLAGVWTFWQLLGPTDTVPVRAFGSSVAITHRPLSPPLTADYVMVGAPLTEGGGAVYAYLRLGDIWGQASKLTAPASHQGNQFGNALAFEGARGIIGAYREGLGDGGPPPGSAYVLEHDGSAWHVTNRLHSPTSQPGEEFGFDVAISGGHAVIGAPANHDGGLSDAGVVYVFHE